MNIELTHFIQQIFELDNLKTKTTHGNTTLISHDTTY